MIALEMARTRAPGYKHPRRSTDSNTDANNVRLRSRECEIFVVPKEAACRSMKVKRMVDANKDQPFWFKDISSNKLEKVMEFCQLVQDDTSVHAEFLSHLDEDALFSTMVNASDLEIKSLLDITVNAKPPRAQTVLYSTTLPTERSSRPRTQSKDRGRARCLAAATLLGRGRFRRDRFGRIVRVSQLGACPRALSESATLSRTCAAPIWRRRERSCVVVLYIVRVGGLLATDPYCVCKVKKSYLLDYTVGVYCKKNSQTPTREGQ